MANVNGVQASGAATGSAPVVAAIGSDANVPLQLSAQGTSNILVGNTGTASATAGAATLNAQRGTITSEALTTAAGSDYVLTLTNNRISATSIVLPVVDNGTNSTEGMAVNRVTPGSGSVVIRIRNTHASAAWNGTLKISFMVL